ncbi:hypothetical protein [Cyprinid herpesvirus 3]|uniref:Capsid triplex subunit 1 n=1 Tax=Cyprinid herpesvirus 3 TaxID=180230 RepID=A3QMN4_CYHV3|nr:unnamed protein product [Cyprinid herpesvirus 3]ABC55178.1 hypothetical protein [Cyprinid herpesvirus 3]ABG42893.1 capsid triplex subunit 1 [Cyprinid herpesvirus 3]AJP55554.1 capsid triplex subunit 1 [Cyprinid herpesvirus 3]AJP55709.1 capsid triplex subunit 1 [Cyprinid herpesvirus 3]AVL27522.1 capsid triplex subunit 1 [Cyprinid herpesvirus 3]
MVSLQQPTKDGLSLGGFDHEIINVPLWCCTASDKIEHFEIMVRCNLGALDEVCHLKDFRALIKTYLESRNLTDVIYTGGGILTAGAPLYAFMKRWNNAVDSVKAKLEVIGATQLAADYNHLIELAARKGTLFEESDVDIITQAIVLCTRDGEDFSRLFTFYGVVTFQSFHTWENMEFSYDRPRQFQIVREGATTIEMARLDLTYKVPYSKVTNPYLVLAALPEKVRGLGSLTKLELFYWSDTCREMRACLASESEGHRCLDSGIHNADQAVIDKWNKSVTHKLYPDTFVSAAFVMGKQVTANPFSPLEKYRAPHYNIWSTDGWKLIHRDSMVELETIENPPVPDPTEPVPRPIRAEPYPAELNAALHSVDPQCTLEPAWVDPRQSTYHQLEDMLEV